MDDETKDVTKDEKVTDERPKEKHPFSKNNHSIFEYLKKESSLLIASISACVAIVASCMKLGAYFKHTAYLRYWNIDLELLSTPETYWLENIALSFAMIVGIFGFLSFLKETNIIHAKNRILIHYGWRKLKERKAEIKEHKSELQKENNNKKKGSQIKKLQAEEKKCKFDRKELSQTELTMWIQYLGHIILALFIFGTIFALALLQSEEHLEDAIRKSALYSIFLCIMIGVTEAHQSKSEKHQLKEEFDKKHDNDGVGLPNYPIKKIFQNGVKNYLSNWSLISKGFFLLSICVAFLFNSYNEGQMPAQNKKKHLEIATINNQEYALVANDKDCMIGERIERGSKNTFATIYTNEQIIIKKEGVSFQVYAFDDLILEQSTKAVIP